jgi:hypothetical protein
MSVDEIVVELESIITKAKDAQTIDAPQLGFLFAPTGVIQDTAIDNNWGEEFLRIAEVVDQYVGRN